MKQFIFNIFNEKSSWLGLFAVTAAFGLELTPDQTQALATFGAICIARNSQ